MAHRINAAGLSLVKHFEGLYLTAYQCPSKVWTIGYGHTGRKHQDGSVYPGLTITEAQAEKLLLHDLNNFAAGVESRLLPKARDAINDNQFAALISFAFNCGLGNLERSTLLQRVNAQRWTDCPAEFLKWTRSRGRILRGLVRRRQSETNLFQLALGPATEKAMRLPVPGFIVRA